jgi:hypothetical protein
MGLVDFLGRYALRGLRCYWKASAGGVVCFDGATQCPSNVTPEFLSMAKGQGICLVRQLRCFPSDSASLRAVCHARRQASAIPVFVTTIDVACCARAHAGLPLLLHRRVHRGVP